MLSHLRARTSHRVHHVFRSTLLCRVQGFLSVYTPAYTLLVLLDHNLATFDCHSKHLLTALIFGSFLTRALPVPPTDTKYQARNASGNTGFLTKQGSKPLPLNPESFLESSHSSTISSQSNMLTDTDDSVRVAVPVFSLGEDNLALYDYYDKFKTYVAAQQL